MIDHQHLLTGAGQRAERTQPLDARNIHGHNQIDIAAHLVRVDQ